MRKRLGLIIVLGALVLAVFINRSEIGTEKDVKVINPSRMQLKSTMDLVGIVGFQDVQYYASEYGGKVANVYKVEGERVSKGDAVIRFDSAAFEAQMEETLYLAANSNTQVISAFSPNYEEDGIYQKKLNQLAKQIADRTLRARMDGIVARLDTSVGELAAPGQVCMVICGDEKVIRAKVSGIDAGKIQEGQEVNITCDRETTTGRITRIRYLPTQADGLEIEIKPFTTIAWVAGSGVELEVITNVYAAQLALPYEAMAHDGSIWVLSGGKAHKAQVITGEYSSTAFEIVSGIEQEDQVILTWQGLKDGQKVQGIY